MNKRLTLLVGPPGSGKSTLAKKEQDAGTLIISQDSMGKGPHMEAFNRGVLAGTPMVVDRMNFNKEQRDKYLIPAREAGYTTEIFVFHENYDTCLERCLKRQNHPTIKVEKDAVSALRTFFTKYERVQDSEADSITRVYPEVIKPEAVIVDLDGTMCNIDHRLNYVRGDGKKDWKAFFDNIQYDTINLWCHKLVSSFYGSNTAVVFCSGRPDTYRKVTEDWLNYFGHSTQFLYMRNGSDNRPDHIVKEIILDFELLTRFTPLFFIDDRRQVYEMWRKRGFVCLACAEGNF